METSGDGCTSEASLAHAGVLWDAVEHLALAGRPVQASGLLTGIQVLTERADKTGSTSGKEEGGEKTDINYCVLVSKEVKQSRVSPVPSLFEPVITP